MAIRRAAVLGAGSWGTALAKVLADNGFETALWGRDRALLEHINAHHENVRYLQGIALPEAVIGVPEIAEPLQDAEVVTVVVPSHALRDLAREIAHILPRSVPIVNAMKGIENESLELPSQILVGCLPQALHAQLTYLSGPSFAREVATGVPTG